MYLSYFLDVVLYVYYYTLGKVRTTNVNKHTGSYVCACSTTIGDYTS